MKKIVSLVMSIILVCSLTIMPTSAVNNVEEYYDGSKINFTVNEYDMLVEARGMTDNELSEFYSEERIEAIRTAEDALLERAQLSDSVLEQYGYTPEQIEVLRAYDGGPLEDNPQLRAITATMSGSISAAQCTSTTVGTQFNWTWSALPLVYNFTDVVAIRWAGTNTQGSPMNVSMVQTSSSFAYVTYYNLINQIQSVQNLSFINVWPYDHAEVNFSCGHVSSGLGDPAYYAKTGRVQVVVQKPSGSTGTLLEGAFAYSYGHSTITITSPTVSFPAGFSISFGTGTSSMYYGAAIVTTGGSIRPYN